MRAAGPLGDSKFCEQRFLLPRRRRSGCLFCTVSLGFALRSFSSSLQRSKGALQLQEPGRAGPWSGGHCVTQMQCQRQQDKHPPQQGGCRGGGEGAASIPPPSGSCLLVAAFRLHSVQLFVSQLPFLFLFCSLSRVSARAPHLCPLLPSSCSPPA